jgi:hypothetical protein
MIALSVVMVWDDLRPIQGHDIVVKKIIQIFV